MSEKIPEWVEAGGTGSAVLASDNNSNKAKPYSDEALVSKFPMIVCAKEWEIERSNAGKMVISSIARKKKSKLRIELRRNLEIGSGFSTYSDLESGLDSSDWSEAMADGDIILLNLLRERKNKSTGTTRGSMEQNKDDVSVSTFGINGIDDRDASGDDLYNDSNWEVALSVALPKINLMKADGSKCQLSVGAGKEKSESLLYFASEFEARAFTSFVKDLQLLSRKLGQEAMRKSLPLSNGDPSHNKGVHFLIEIVSASDLKPVNRNRYSDPYIVVRFGGDEVHRTKVIKKNLDPIWTVETGSFFLLTFNPAEFYSSELIFEVRDYETFVPGKSLGQAVLSTQRLLGARGERIETRLKNLQLGTFVQGLLALRCRRATESDIEFMKNVNSNSLSTKRSQTQFITPSAFKTKSLNFKKKKQIDGIRKYLLRPPRNGQDQNWVSKEEVEILSMQKSESWVEAGTGDVGTVFIEIIRCDDLPDLDHSMNPHDKTDTFVNLVLEDTIVTTDVVKDCLSPRFMPWTRRAFKLRFNHPSSTLYLGVFDYDGGSLTNHGSIGHLNISLKEFSPSTEYNLSYDIYNSIESPRRAKRGRITVRLRMDWENQRRLYFRSLQGPEKSLINIESKKNFKHAQFTVKGYENVEEYSMKTLLSLVDELYRYISVIINVKDAIKTIILWRGHYSINICNYIRIKLPLHSIIAFGLGVIYTERPRYGVSIFFFVIAWFMLAMLEHRHKRPSPCDPPPSYRHLLFRFITGISRPVDIKPNEVSQESIDIWLAKSKANEAEANKVFDTYMQDLEAMGDDEQEIKDAFTKRNGLPVNMPVNMNILKNILHPYQLILLDICYKLRFVQNILNWNHMYLAFWITSISIALSVVSFFLWEEVWLWVKRIFICGLLGPWMKVLDWFYFQQLERMTNEEKAAKERKRLRRLRSWNEKEFNASRADVEKTVKLASMKKHMFGHYILEVPRLGKPARFPSVPRVGSYAVPTSKEFHSIRRSFTLGQKLSGDMVPVNYIEHIDSAGSLTEKDALLKKRNGYGATSD